MPVDGPELALTIMDTPPEKKKQKKKNRYNVIGCKNCGATNVTLIKATDSYYCKFCFDKLGKKKYKK